VFFFNAEFCLCVLSGKKFLRFIAFCQSFAVETPYSLPSQNVFNFLSQWYIKPYHFSSDIMDLFLAGADQPQTNQPNDQAGSSPYLVNCQKWLRGRLMHSCMEEACHPKRVAILSMHVSCVHELQKP